MERSPIILAHDYARKASRDTQKSRFVSATSEHEHASAQYAKAAADTGDVQALRVLKLLEQQHQKLAEILHARNKITSRAATAAEIPKKAEEVHVTSSSHVDETTTVTVEASNVASPDRPAIPSFLKTNERRDSSPALAKDIASRRGIPPSHARRKQTTAPLLSSPEVAVQIASLMPKAGSAAQTPIPGGHASLDAKATDEPLQHATDEGFSKFYYNLTSTPLSKLSSMLAFAGLPLTEQDAKSSPSQSQRIESTSARATTGADVDKIFSKASLRALEEQQRRQGLSGAPFGPGESFYVIPASGGTASYANIAARQQASRQSENDETSKKAVDPMAEQNYKSPLEESALPPSSLREEELQTENAALKQVLDKLAHRLQAFESHAQDASMAALTQSMASLQHHHSSPGTNPEMEDRMRAMEHQLEREMKERERLVQETHKQKQVISKYRSHWEQLKDSARAKDKAKREKTESGTG